MRIVRGFAMLTMIAVLGISVAGYKSQTSQSAENILKRQAQISRTDSITTSSALTTALSAAGVPGGIATVTQCGEDARYMFASTGTTLENALNTIVSTNSEYTWQVKDGVVNVFPVTGEPLLLRQNIRVLDIREVVSIHETVRQVLSKPEVRKRIAELNLSEGFVRIGMSDLKRAGSSRHQKKQTYTLSLRNVTLRDVLNAIARVNGKGVWEYRERHCNGKTEFQLQFLVS